MVLSSIRIKDIRKYIYYSVRDKFDEIQPRNIQLAYRTCIQTPQFLQDQYNQALQILKSQGVCEQLPLEPIYYKYEPIEDENLTIK